MAPAAKLNSSFLCYRRSLSAFVARSVYERLRDDLDVFLDVESIDEGNWWDVIAAQIRARPYFLLVLTPKALEGCRDPDDVMRRELQAGVSISRHLVPLVTPDFERDEIEKSLPPELAQACHAANWLKVDHEYFNAAMEKLRTRFLKPVELPVEPPTRELADRAAALLGKAASLPPVPAAALSIQKHLERALACAETNPALAHAEINSAHTLTQQTAAMQTMATDLNLMYLELQQRMRRETELFTVVSNILKQRHDAVKLLIGKIR